MLRRVRLAAQIPPEAGEYYTLLNENGRKTFGVGSKWTDLGVEYALLTSKNSRAYEPQ